MGWIFDICDYFCCQNNSEKVEPFMIVKFMQANNENKKRERTHNCPFWLKFRALGQNVYGRPHFSGPKRWFWQIILNQAGDPKQLFILKKIYIIFVGIFMLAHAFC